MNKIVEEYLSLNNKARLNANRQVVRYNKHHQRDVVLTDKEMQAYIDHKKSLKTAKVEPNKECLLSRLIFKPNEVQATDKDWKVISTKLKRQDAIKLDQLAFDHKTTPSALLRGYVEELLKSTK